MKPGDLVTTHYSYHVKRVTNVDGDKVTCEWGSGNKTMRVTYQRAELILYKHNKE